jgi:hypothetical protein
MAHHVVLRMLHPESRARCIAHYVVPVSSPSGRKWLSVLIVSPTVAPFAGCSIMDAKDWIRLAGRVLPGWLDTIRHRNLVASITDKVCAAYHSGATLADMAKTYGTDKHVIMKIIQDCRAADRKVPARGGATRKDTAR